MKKYIVAMAVLACAAASADTYVQPYVTKDGTFVEGHWRSSSNSTKTDNYSSQGNVNPYTGKRGSEDPYDTTPSTRSRSQSYGTQCGVDSRGNFVCK